MQFSNCIPVKGYSRSALYDVQNTRYLLVSNQFAETLIENNNKIPLSNKNRVFEVLIENLVKDGWGIYTTKSVGSNFPDLNLQWKHYAEITNAQIDFMDTSESTSIFFQNILPQIEELNCKTLQINMLNSVDFNELSQFLMEFNDTLIQQLVIYLPYVFISEEQSNQLFAEQPRLDILCYYNCPNDINHQN